MKLLEALKLAQRTLPSGAPRFDLALLCGFTPLHLETFLAAQLALLHPARVVKLSSGLYGDLAGSLERINPTGLNAAAVALEWSDLDARLGFRSSGGWDPDSLPDILHSARLQLQRISRVIAQLAPLPVALSLPTLPLPPVAFSRPDQLGSFEADLRLQLAQCAQSLACQPHVRAIAVQELDRISPPAARLDLKSDLAAGFPYTLAHADSLAQMLATLASPPPRKKGIITDLDDTLWLGILGEVGVAGVEWSLAGHAQLHGLYQQLLASLAASGTLVAVASKNDPGLAGEVLQRADLLLPATRIFPIEASWGPKSQAVARILQAWNIGEDSVVFVDDSPMELAEVQARFPAIECVLFPKDDPAKFHDLLLHLRRRFGAPQVLREDLLRAGSLRAQAEVQAVQEIASGDAEAFLRAAAAEVTFHTSKRDDPRAFELINKTNQFNLNGVRITESEWQAMIADPRRFLLKVEYKDRYGPLGTIAVLAGTAGDGGAQVDHWVMSCRAFSRRIEHSALAWIFANLSDRITLRFAPTPRNGPTQEFLATLLDPPLSPPLHIDRALFESRCPPLYHSIVEGSH